MLLGNKLSHLRNLHYWNMPIVN